MEFSGRYSWCNLVKCCGKRARELVPRAKSLVTKPDDLSLMPGTPVVEGRNLFLQVAPDLCTNAVACWCV